MAIDQPEVSAVDVLAIEFVAEIRRGERPDVADYERRHPELAEEIRELFPTIEQLERARTHHESADDGLASLGPTRLKRLGDLRIIREVGRGGMGIVYLAEQESLQRRVAVKVLPRQSLLDEQHLRRFEREARTAAKLHHTNIVPILGVGQNDGLRYYVMQYIRGVGLDRVLAALRQQPNDQAPNAIERTAHEDSTKEESTTRGAPSGEPNREGERADATVGEDAARIATAMVCNDFTATIAAAAAAAGAEYDVARQAENSNTPPSESGAKASDPLDATIALEPSSIRTGSGDSAQGNVSGAAERQSAIDTARVAPGDARYARCVAGLGHQVAEALHYAHERGTLHRDIKPGNLIVDPQGTVWVADFGLAKTMEHDDLSRTGDVVGTLRYMAPEQFVGRHDARSDIFSLGLTLYELLTLRPAYDDAERRKSLAGRAGESDVVPPRRWNPAIPRDLETIVLKAMASETE